MRKWVLWMNLEYGIVPEELGPVIEYRDMLILFDTGASVPVWCGDVDYFKRKFPDAEKRRYRFLLTGFGRSEEEMVQFLKNPNSKEAGDYFADVYSVPEFILKAGQGKIIWTNLNVAVTDRKFSGIHLILPYTMFKRMQVSFDQTGRDARIRIESLDEFCHMFVRLKDLGFSETLLRFVYSQDDKQLDS